METVIFEQYEIVVRRATIRDALRAETIARRAMEAEKEGALGYWNTFGDLCSQVESWRGLPFDPTTLHEQDAATVHAAYEQYMALPKELGVAWRAAVAKVDAPADTTLAPVPNAHSAGRDKKKQKATQRSA